MNTNEFHSLYADRTDTTPGCSVSEIIKHLCYTFSRLEEKQVDARCLEKFTAVFVLGYYTYTHIGIFMIFLCRRGGEETSDKARREEHHLDHFYLLSENYIKKFERKN